jgi:hypothetical protein
MVLRDLGVISGIIHGVLAGSSHLNLQQTPCLWHQNLRESPSSHWCFGIQVSRTMSYIYCTPATGRQMRSGADNYLGTGTRWTASDVRVPPDVEPYLPDKPQWLAVWMQCRAAT